MSRRGGSNFWIVQAQRYQSLKLIRQIRSAKYDNSFNYAPKINSYIRFLQSLGFSTYMKLYYEFPEEASSDQYITIMLETNQPFWFAFGLGTAMNNGDQWLFNVNEAAQNITPFDCFGNNYTGPSYDVLFGGEDNLILLGYSYNSSISLVKFKRLLDTGDQHDSVIYQGHTMVYLAFGVPPNQSVAFHQQNRAVVEFQFIEGRRQVIQITKDWFSIHKWINLVCWGCLVDIPIIIARFFKTCKWYIWIHGTILTFVVLTSLLGESLMIYSYSLNYQWENFNASNAQSQIHLVLGTSIIFLMFMQVFGGWFLNFVIEDRISINNKISFKKLLHQISGYLIYFIGKVNVLVGVLISAESIPFSNLEIIVYSIFLLQLVLRIALEIPYQREKAVWFFLIAFINTNRKKKFRQESSEDSTVTTSFVKMLNHIELLEFEIIDQECGNKKWCIFNNSVINLTDQLHPGGQFIWEQCQGREISRFIYGVYGLECTTLPPYKHSEYTIKMLEKLTVGTLRLVPLFSEELLGFNTWRLSGRQDFSNYLTMFEFQKQGITFMTTLNGIENFGRHFLLKSTRNDSISCRPYTMVLSMAKPNFEFRQMMIAECAKILRFEHQIKIQINSKEFQQYYSDFPLIVKKYTSKTGFSQYLHSLQIGDEVSLSGPFGTSFGIDHQETGQVVLVAGGTGILPFLDFLEFLLKKTIIQLIENSTEMNLNPSGIDYDRYFGPTFQLVLFLSVQIKQDMVGSDIYLTLSRLQEFLPFPNFKFILSTHNKIDNYPGVIVPGKVRFDGSLFAKYMDPRKVARILICGPPTMNQSVPDAFVSLGVSRLMVHLV